MTPGRRKGARWTSLTLATVDSDVVKWVAIGTIATVAIVGGYLSGMFKASARERSRREIAAYIAEGSMTPEQGEKLMKAGNPSDWSE